MTCAAIDVKGPKTNERSKRTQNILCSTFFIFLHISDKSLLFLGIENRGPIMM